MMYAQQGNCYNFRVNLRTFSPVGEARRIAVDADRDISVMNGESSSKEMGLSCGGGEISGRVELKIMQRHSLQSACQQATKERVL
jgi:hypothetical protein